MPTTRPPPSSLKKSRRSRSKSCRRREMLSCWASSELAGGRMLAFPFQLGGPLDRFHDAWIGAAAADVAVHALNDLFWSGIGGVVEKRHGSENHPRGTVAALEGFDFEERLLHGIELAPAPQAFDGRNLLSGNGARRDSARANRQAFDENGAGSALAFAASVFGAGQSEMVAQNIEKALVLGCIHAVFGAVNQ